MISILTMSVTAITNAVIYVLKAFFSLVLWFFKFLMRGAKICFTLLPVFTIAFAVFILIEIFLIVTGQNPFPEDIVGSQSLEQSSALMTSLQQWWVMQIYPFRGKATYYLLLFLTVMMFLPVMTIFLSIAVFMTFGKFLILSLAADGALYIIFTVFGKPFFVQILDRYYRLFPDAGIRHEERNYARLLKMRNRELEDDLRKRDFYRDSDFYSYDNRSCIENDYEEYDDQEYDEEFDEAYGQDDEYYEDEGYEEDGYDIDEYEDEAYEKDNAEINADMFAKRKEPFSFDGFRERQQEYRYTESSHDDRHQSQDQSHSQSQAHQKSSSDSNTSTAGGHGSFDFFAGCNSRESVDKKYKSLVKLYHPDNMDGDTAALQEINVQYDKAKKRFGA